MTQILAIAMGGALGSVLRFWMSGWVSGILGRGFPYGTLMVNVSGSLLMGFLYVLLVDKFNASDEWRAFLLIGLLGGFTTFSSFSMETFDFIATGEVFKAFMNIVLSVAVCLVATWLGIVMGREI